MFTDRFDNQYNLHENNFNISFGMSFDLDTVGYHNSLTTENADKTKNKRVTLLGL